MSELVQCCLAGNPVRSGRDDNSVWGWDESPRDLRQRTKTFWYRLAAIELLGPVIDSGPLKA
jgi:hypothetical protein